MIVSMPAYLPTCRLASTLKPVFVIYSNANNNNEKKEEK
jgi:hypothetical protein